MNLKKVKVTNAELPFLVSPDKKLKGEAAAGRAPLDADLKPPKPAKALEPFPSC